MKRDKDGAIIKEVSCLHTTGGGVICSEWVICTDACNTCGWNPAVKKQRLDRIHANLEEMRGKTGKPKAKKEVHNGNDSNAL